ncbi:hypothetical protein D3C85_1235220 [compost metagenome]
MAKPELKLSREMVNTSICRLAPMSASIRNRILVAADETPPMNRIGRMPKRTIARPPKPAPSRVMIRPKILLTLAICSLLKPWSM